MDSVPVRTKCVVKLCWYYFTDLYGDDDDGGSGGDGKMCK